MNILSEVSAPQNFNFSLLLIAFSAMSTLPVSVCMWSEFAKLALHTSSSLSLRKTCIQPFPGIIVCMCIAYRHSQLFRELLFLSFSFFRFLLTFSKQWPIRCCFKISLFLTLFVYRRWWCSSLFTSFHTLSVSITLVLASHSPNEHLLFSFLPFLILYTYYQV